MRRGTRASLSRSVLIGVVAVLALAGCAQRQGTAYNAPPTPEPAVSSANHGVVFQAGPRVYYHDDSGGLYYTDANGGLHMVERKLRVEQGTGGLYTIIGDNNERYHYDESGRIFYRDNAGRPIYVEEGIAPGKPIDPLNILAPAKPMRYRSDQYCSDEWNTCERHCDDSPGLTNKRNCLEDCDYKREQCLQPY